MLNWWDSAVALKYACIRPIERRVLLLSFSFRFISISLVHLQFQTCHPIYCWATNRVRLKSIHICSMKKRNDFYVCINIWFNHRANYYIPLMVVCACALHKNVHRTKNHFVNICFRSILINARNSYENKWHRSTQNISIFWPCGGGVLVVKVIYARAHYCSFANINYYLLACD